MGKRRHVDYSPPPFSGIEKPYSEISSLFRQIQVPDLQEHHVRSLALRWKIGKLIVEYKQQQATKSEDTQELLLQLSKQLVKSLRVIFPAACGDCLT